MQSGRKTLLTRLTLPLALAPMLAQQATGQRPASQPLPDIRQLMHEVQAHQRQLDKVRENYTYSTLETTQDIDSSGNVTRTESVEQEDFFVNGHLIARTVKKDGKPLSEREQQKETESVTKLVEKAEKTSPDQPLQGQTISISRILDIMDVRNPRRETVRGRSTIVFDFVGRKDAKTHGMIEDASKKLQGTLWVDEADRQVAHMDVSFDDNFHIAGGLLANIQKGSNFHFDQAPVNHPNDKDLSSGTPANHPNDKVQSSGTPAVNDGLWLPTGGEGTMQAKLLMVRNIRKHFVERDYDYKRFRVEAQQAKDTRVVPEKAQ